MGQDLGQRLLVQNDLRHTSTLHCCPILCPIVQYHTPVCSSSCPCPAIHFSYWQRDVYILYPPYTTCPHLCTVPIAQASHLKECMPLAGGSQRQGVILWLFPLERDTHYSPLQAGGGKAKQGLARDWPPGSLCYFSIGAVMVCSDLSVNFNSSLCVCPEHVIRTPLHSL